MIHHKLLINGIPHTVNYHTPGDPRQHYCVAIIENGSRVAVHSLPKYWPPGSKGTLKTSGCIYRWGIKEG